MISFLRFLIFLIFFYFSFYLFKIGCWGGCEEGAQGDDN